MQKLFFIDFAASGAVGGGGIKGNTCEFLVVRQEDVATWRGLLTKANSPRSKHQEIVAWQWQMSRYEKCFRYQIRRCILGWALGKKYCNKLSVRVIRAMSKLKRVALDFLDTF